MFPSFPRPLRTAYPFAFFPQASARQIKQLREYLMLHMPFHCNSISMLNGAFYSLHRLYRPAETVSYVVRDHELPLFYIAVSQNYSICEILQVRALLLCFAIAIAIWILPNNNILLIYKCTGFPLFRLSDGVRRRHPFVLVVAILVANTTSFDGRSVNNYCYRGGGSSGLVSIMQLCHRTIFDTVLFARRYGFLMT